MKIIILGVLYYILCIIASYFVFLKLGDWIARSIVESKGIIDPKMSWSEEYSITILFVLASPFVGLLVGLLTRNALFRKLNLGS